MIELGVTIDNGAPIASVLSGLATQLPYAYSVAINDTLNDAQAAVRDRLPHEFTLRRQDFIDRTIYIAPKDRATKTRLVGTLRVDPSRDFLAKFEDGGEKSSTSGKALAVPVFRESAPNLIIGRNDPLSVKRLMDSIANRRGRILTARVRKGHLFVGEDPNKVYLVKTAKGTFIIQRIGKISEGLHSTRVLYAFEPQVPIKDQLHFEDTAMAAALASWDTNVDTAIALAIATAR
jgi:hypothetical protein